MKPEYWDSKTLCAAMWILQLTAMPLLSRESQKELKHGL
jgi:hypothetical protein